MPEKKSKKLKKLLKVEPTDLNPISHYAEVDDRLELIRQVFLSLKPKTIKTFCPEFLQVSFPFVFVRIFN
jgi:hypothetical protein